MRSRHLVSIVAACVVSGCSPPTASRAAPALALETVHRFEFLAASDFVTDFDFAADGSLWVTTFESRLIRVSNGETREEEVPFASPADPRPQIHDLYVDARGRPWLAVGARIAMYDGSRWLDQGPPSLVGIRPVSGRLAVNEADDVALSLGDVDTGGLFLRTNGVWTVLRPDNSTLPSPITNRIGVGEDDDFWVASAQWRGLGGLSRVSGGALTRLFTKDAGWLYNQVDDVVANSSDVWVAFEATIYDRGDVAEGGIQRVNANTGAIASIFPATSGLSSNRVSHLLRSAAGELWFVTALDHHPTGCATCFPAVGVIDPSGAMRVISTLNADVAPDESFAALREGPEGTIYVARTLSRDIARIIH